MAPASDVRSLVIIVSSVFLRPSCFPQSRKRRFIVVLATTVCNRRAPCLVAALSPHMWLSNQTILLSDGAINSAIGRGVGRSDQGIAAIDGEILTGRIAGLVGQEEHGRAEQFAQGAVAAGGYLGEDIRLHVRRVI